MSVSRRYSVGIASVRGVVEALVDVAGGAQRGRCCGGCNGRWLRSVLGLVPPGERRSVGRRCNGGGWQFMGPGTSCLCNLALHLRKRLPGGTGRRSPGAALRRGSVPGVCDAEPMRSSRAGTLCHRGPGSGPGRDVEVERRGAPPPGPGADLLFRPACFASPRPGPRAGTPRRQRPRVGPGAGSLKGQLSPFSGLPFGSVERPTMVRRVRTSIGFCRKGRPATASISSRWAAEAKPDIRITSISG